ncbi:MAG: threonine synthase, partial [Clostridia bacterium]|nr:threonine synthase [Clostridia bacterium]
LSDSYSYGELLEDCRGAYKSESFGKNPAPVTDIGDGVSVLELWHGPTCAFKDMALQVMPRLFVRAVRKTGDKRKALILVATSGDTGKAALEGYRDVDGVDISVFYPVNGVSRVQKLQMATQDGKNVRVRSVKGNFDDAQTGVKKIFSSPEMAKKLEEKGFFLSSANSINWGRLVPQICYYVSAYCDMVNAGNIKNGDKIDVCVPTGNFGNILAGYIEKKMGLPVDKLICASNSNDVLTDFFKTGTYDRNRPFHTTVSPSMDILISSNLERLLFLTCGEEKTANYMEKLNKTGKYTVEKGDMDVILADFKAGCCDEENTAKTIKDTFEKKNYLIDTHTSVGLSVGLANKGENPLLVVSTASAYKFSPAVLKSINGETPDELDAITRLNEISGVSVPAPLADIGKRKIIFNPDDSINPSDMEKDVLGI